MITDPNEKLAADEEEFSNEDDDENDADDDEDDDEMLLGDDDECLDIAEDETVAMNISDVDTDVSVLEENELGEEEIFDMSDQDEEEDVSEDDDAGSMMDFP